MDNNAVPVIASFTADGTIEPLYIRIDGIPLKVIKCTSESNFVYHNFDCVVDDSGVAKHVKIGYNHSYHIWYKF